VAARTLAALAFALAAFGAAADDLGTLFHTPEERARLDRLRRGEPERENAPAAAGRAPSITGYVKRSDGRSTVWIDGAPVTLATPEANRLLEPGTVRGYSNPGDESLRIERKPQK
jgi:hypothetical protein